MLRETGSDATVEGDAPELDRAMNGQGRGRERVTSQTPSERGPAPMTSWFCLAPQRHPSMSGREDPPERCLE